MLKEKLRSFVVFIFWIFARRVLASSCTSRCGVPSAWFPVARNVCYGTKNNAFGSFTIHRDCHLYKIRLSHVKGYQTCCKKHPSRWGDHANFPYFNTVLLKKNKLWCPDYIDRNGNFNLKGFDNNDDVIVLSKNDTLTAGTELQVAFGRDYIDHARESNNEGTHCIDIDISCIV